MLPLLCCCFLATIIVVKAVIYVTLYILIFHIWCSAQKYTTHFANGWQAGGKERSGHQKKSSFAPSRAIFIFCVGVDDDDDPDDNDKMLSVRCQTANLNGVIYVNVCTCCMCEAKDFR